MSITRIRDIDVNVIFPFLDHVNAHHCSILNKESQMLLSNALKNRLESMFLSFKAFTLLSLTTIATITSVIRICPNPECNTKHECMIDFIESKVPTSCVRYRNKESQRYVYLHAKNKYFNICDSVLTIKGYD